MESGSRAPACPKCLPAGKMAASAPCLLQSAFPSLTTTSLTTTSLTTNSYQTRVSPLVFVWRQIVLNYS